MVSQKDINRKVLELFGKSRETDRRYGEHIGKIEEDLEEQAEDRKYIESALRH